MVNRVATLLIVLTAASVGPAAAAGSGAAAPRSAAYTQPSAKARVSFADCVEALKAQGGGWCEMAGATIAEVFPKQFSPNVWGWSGPQSVILAWNGAAWDSKRRKWYFYGGGHTDYGGNEVYEFDLKSATFTRLTDPSAIPDKTPDNKCPEPVSGPRSQHTYDGIIFSSVTDTIWVFPGSTGYCNGGIVNLQGKVWEFNPDRINSRNGIPPLSWRLNPIEMPAPLRSFLRSAELPDGRIYVANNDRSAFFDPRTGAWSLSSGTRADFGHGNMIYDPATKSYWEINYSDFISGRPGAPIIDRLSKHVFGTSSGSGLGMVDGRYVYAWDGGHDVARWDVEAKRWSVSRNAAGPHGTHVYSKFVWLEPERVFLGYSNPREGVWVYRPPQDGWTEAAMTPAQRYIDQARVGSTVEIPPGIYSAGIVIEKPLTVRLKGVSFGSPVGGKGYIVVHDAGPVVIDDFTTTRPPGCASNCAGVRGEGDFDVTIRRAHIAHTEMGILTGNEGKGKLTIEDSLIEDMGGGSDLSHGIYFGVGDTLIVRNTMVQRGHNLGHLIKSRARRTVVDHVRVLGLDGVYSRELEFPCGGDITVKNSVIEKGPSTDNAELLAVNIEYKPGLPPGDPQQGNCGVNAGQKTSFTFTDNWVIFDRKAVAPERAYSAGPNQFGKWRNLPPGTPMIVKSNKFVGMKTWAEFPDLSSENTMYRDRAAAGLGPSPELPRPGR